MRIQPGPDRQPTNQPLHFANIFYVRNICKVEGEGVSRSRLYLQQSCSSQRTGSCLPFISAAICKLSSWHWNMPFFFLESSLSLSLSTTQSAYIYPPSSTASFFTMTALYPLISNSALQSAFPQDPRYHPDFPLPASTPAACTGVSQRN